MAGMLALLAFPFVVQSNLQETFVVEQPIRLALTPRIDGKWSADEWCPLSNSGNAQSYLQWEPGILYAAAVVENDSAIVSLDLAGDGWLVGNDNLEIKLTRTDSGLDVHSRLLDCTNRQGPVWRQTPLVKGQIDAAVGDHELKNLFEFKLFTTGLIKLDVNSKLGARFDSGIDMTTLDAPSTPRNTALLRMQFDRSLGLTPGLQWNSQYGARSVVPGESISIRLNFSGKTQPPFERIDLRTKGVENTATMGIAFPQFRRDRGFVDYKTLIPSDAVAGYRVVEGTLIGGESGANVETSFRIADTVVFDVRLPDNLTAENAQRTIKGSYTVRSQTDKRLDGDVTIEIPDGWAINKGNESKFHIYFSRGSAKFPIELVAPAGAHGVVPLKFKATIGDKIVETTYLFWIR